ncbi:MAG: hypothetical protein ABFS43_16650 [Thermodesulfobacteriota bacterium]
MERINKYNWSAPVNLNEWVRRVFAIRPLLVCLIFLAIMISELRFDWMERTMGAFLVSTNSRRPESGTIWETGRQTRKARKTLDQIVSDRQTSQQETRQAESFKEIAATILPDQWVMISPDQFRRLYLQLNPETAVRIISSFDLVQLINREHWDRTYFEKDGDGLNIYLLDTENRVLRQLTISPDLLYGMGESQVEMDTSLEEMLQFGNRIYTADRFFQALDRLEDGVRRDVLPQPDQLLRYPGRITRVGISGRDLSGFTELGFEIESAMQRMVILMNGHENAVLELRYRLDGRKIKPHKQEGR